MPIFTFSRDFFSSHVAIHFLYRPPSKSNSRNLRLATFMIADAIFRAPHLSKRPNLFLAELLDGRPQLDLLLRQTKQPVVY